MSRLLPRHSLAAPLAPAPSRRIIHPWAWWAWAISVAVAATLSDALVTLVGIAVVLVLVATLRRNGTGFGRSMRFYLVLASVIVLLRLGFRVLLGGASSGTVLFTLPELKLPAWAAGIRLGGPVVWEDLVQTTVDAGRLAVLILAVGAAMTLADPRTTLKSVPAALHDISVAVVITLTVLPALITSGRRILRSKRLRGHNARGMRSLLSTVVPVMEDAVEGSMTLATSMEVRGYGRTRNGAAVGPATTAALLTAIALLTLGAFVLIGVTPTPPVILSLAWQTWLAIALLAAGGVLGAVALRRSGRRLATTRYRPAPWGAPEWRVTLIGLAAGFAAVVLAMAEAGAWFGLVVPGIAALVLTERVT